MKEIIKDITKRSLKRNNDEIIKPLIGVKADKSYVDTELSKKANSSHGTHVTYGTSAPAANGTASAGTSSAVSRADHVHPIQTSVSGNAGTATKLANARTINGVSFDGSANITITDSTKVSPTGTIVANRIAVFSDTTGKVIKDSGYTIATSVPSGAKFTDTVYTHPNTHAPSIIAQDSNNRFVTDAEKSSWNSKETTSGAQTKANNALASAKAYTDEKVAAFVDSAPETLDTLNELAKALGNDPNFATTVSNKIGLKADKSYVDTELGKKANSSHGRHMLDACETVTDWNNATKNGWYMGNNAANGPTTVASGGTIWYFGEVIAHNTNYVVQTVYQFTASTDAKAIPKYIRAKMNGTWGAWTNVTVAKAVPSNAVFTDTNTWRGVQDNLTSTATDQSLSANQGKVLKGLIDGKAAASHTHTDYVATSGGTVTGRLTTNGKISVPTSGANWLSGKTITNASIAVTTQQTTNSYHPVLAVKTSGNHVANIGGLGDDFGFYGYNSNRTENGTDWSFRINASNGQVISSGQITAPTFVGSLNGNAKTATTLATARTINGVSFNGSANITVYDNTKLATANVACGTGTFNSTTGRAITIGKTMSSANYRVNITATSNPNGALGEVWVGNKTTTGFTVYCSGSTTTTTFDWTIMI